MTELTPSAESPRRAGVRRAKKHLLRVDMTPMVDLGFILITFFVMTVELAKPASLKLNMPKESSVQMHLGESNALTVLLDGDHIYYYHGDWQQALSRNEIHLTNLSVTNGLGTVIREKQKWLDEQHTKEGRAGLMLLIKPGKDASYKKIIDALDEALINAVKKYALLSPDMEETGWMAQQRADSPTRR